MKVSIYVEEEGGYSVLVQASPGKSRPPVLLQHLTIENIKEKTLPVVDAARLPRGATRPTLPL